MKELDPHIKDILAASSVSTKVLAKTMYKDRFHLPFSTAIHDPIFDIINDPGIQRIAIAAPRDSGKSSIVDLALPSRYILYNYAKFVIIISESFEVAAMQTENLKSELTTNPFIKEYFPPIRVRESFAEPEQFSKKQWVVNNAENTIVIPRGAGQQVRGWIYRNSRPDVIIVDDLEDLKEVRNEENRKFLKKWFFSDVCNSIDEDASKPYKIIVIGTILHEDSLLSTLIDHSGWRSLRLDIMDEDGKSNWPEKVSDERLSELYKDAREAGELVTFHMEYRSSVALDDEDAPFSSKYFKWYEEPIQKEVKVESVVLVDPAKSVTPKSDDTAIIGLGVDSDNGRIYVREVVAKKLHPDETVVEIIEMAERLNTITVGVEVTSLNEYITYPLKTEFSRRGKYLDLIELKPRGRRKEERIKSLVPFYRRGQIFHNSVCCHKLEQQLLSFPYSQHDDVMDCLAYAVGMLEEGGRYFVRDYVEESAEDIEKEFEDLEELWGNEPALPARWRGAP